MKMEIKWQRLVDASGQTCERCSCTGEAAEAAFDKLGRCLREIGIEVHLEKISIDQSAFSANPIASNRILIDGTPVEKWLGGTTGSSKCCGPCGDSECRTITIDGHVYEAVPEELIIRAGLLAAAKKFRTAPLFSTLQR